MFLRYVELYPTGRRYTPLDIILYGHRCKNLKYSLILPFACETKLTSGQTDGRSSLMEFCRSDEAPDSHDVRMKVLVQILNLHIKSSPNTFVGISTVQ